MIKTEGLSKNYYLGTQTVAALSDVNLVVEPGEFLAVMGPSGSGKSTLMNLLGCLDTPTRGRYFLEGQEATALHPDDMARLRNLRIGFVFQNFNLLARTSALDNVALPLVYSRSSRRDRKRQAAEALAAVGLADRLDHHPNQLSGGQQQRVAIARALINSPALILADEPTGALDTTSGQEIMALFGSLNGQGMTVVVVTHEPEIAAFARRVIHFRDGRMISDEIQESKVTGPAPSPLAELREQA
ncbi:MAG: ABC transporter ATP-binding protein [Deltaproteobacteria bacterium]|nr:ABC transporter ATP-binding protein [Deltaproteobacteria bacterium]